MGDELSDFFAKKDKKKNKKQKGFTTSQKVAERVESQVQAHAEREKSEGLLAPERPARRTKEDEEWNDFEEEAQPDLSGLRIQSMQRRADGEDAKFEKEEEGEEGERGKNEKGPSGPWQVEDVQPQPAAEPEPAPVASAGESTASQATASSGRYVPPSLRGGSGGASASGPSAAPSSGASAGKYVPPSVRRAEMLAAQEAASAPASRGWGRGRNVVPDVTNSESFPSLQESASSNYQRGGKGFEEVRRGAPSGAPRSRGPDIQLGNKYNPLERS